MKKSIFLSIFLMAFIGSTYANHFQEEKIYINASDVIILNDQIQVQINNQWVQVQELCADAGGIFLRPVGLWTCKCGWHNEDVPNCFKCGKPRPS